jgi:DNA-binding NarL/FixJ family response regulator
MARSVLIVDDSAVIRRTLREVFRDDPDLEVCGEAENGREAIERARQLRPDLIVLDLSMPVMNGLDAARALKRLMPEVSLIMYSAFGDKVVEHQARLIGISGVVSKFEPASALVNEARIVLTQTSAFNPSYAGERGR